MNIKDLLDLSAGGEGSGVYDHKKKDRPQDQTYSKEALDKAFGKKKTRAEFLESLKKNYGKKHEEDEIQAGYPQTVTKGGGSGHYQIFEDDEEEENDDLQAGGPGSGPHATGKIAMHHGFRLEPSSSKTHDVYHNKSKNQDVAVSKKDGTWVHYDDNTLMETSGHNSQELHKFLKPRAVHAVGDINAWCDPETAREHGTKCGKPYSKSKPLERKLKRTKGFTYSYIHASSPKSGFALSVAKKNEKIYEGKPGAQQISAYIKAHMKQLTSDKRAHVGGWYDPSSNKTYLDVSLVEADRKAAIALAQRHNQLAIFDLGTKQVIDTPKIHAAKQDKIYFMFKHTADPVDIAKALVGLGAMALIAQAETSAQMNGPLTIAEVLAWCNPDTAHAHGTNCGRPASGDIQHPKDINEAINLIADGKIVELNDAHQVHTLLDKLAEIANKGGDGKTYDLCNVTVKGTNLFCIDHMGTPRILMPQLSGKPKPGSESEKFTRSTFDNKVVEGGDEFIKHLKSQGIDSKQVSVPAAYLRASQRELIGTKIGQIMNAKNVDITKAPIFISRDNYVIDGHHRWAAIVGREAETGRLGHLRVNAVQVDAPISQILHEANKWVSKVGIQREGASLPKKQPERVLNTTSDKWKKEEVFKK